MKVIIGAGLTGLSAAYHLQSDDYVILEERNDIGGTCSSYYQDGFTFDHTGHVMHFRHDRTRELAKKVLGDNYHTMARRSSIYFRERLVPYPFQMNLAFLPHEVKKECLMGAIKASYEVNTDGHEPANFAEWILQSLGEGIAKHFMFPHNEKLWTVSPYEMTTGWMRRFVPRPNLSDIVEGALRSRRDDGIGYNAEIGYPMRGGVLSYPKAFVPYVKNLFLSAEVAHVDVDARTVQANGITYPFSTLISTMPLVELVRRIKDVPHRIQQVADKLRCNSVYSVLLGVNRPNVSDQHWIYVPQKDLIFHRIGFPSNLSPYMCPEGTSSICAEVAYRGDLDMSQDELIDHVIRDLQSVGLLRETDEILVQMAVVTRYAYVIYDKHHTANVKLIHDYLQEHSIISTGRYGRWEYSGMEDAVLHGQAAAERAQHMEAFEQAFVMPRPEPVQGPHPALPAEAVIDHQEAFEEAFPPPPTDERLQERSRPALPGETDPTPA
jgi:protoporphyrinogen oxidase